MADLREIYELNIAGNFEEKLAAISASVDQVRTGWKSLADQFKARGAVFRTAREEMLHSAGAMSEAEKATYKLTEKEVELDSATRTLAKAANRLTREQNALKETYIAESTALDLLTKKADPRIIQARGEVAAAKQLARELTKVVQQRVFEQLAAEAGLEIHTKSEKVFNAEAVAASRAAKAQQELAVATLLASQGLDPRGKKLDVQGPPLPGTATKGKLSADQERAAQLKVNAEKQKVYSDAYLKQLRLEAGLLDGNNEKISNVSKQLAAAGSAAKSAESPFNRFLFTFRRLVGVMAVFTVARTVVSGFNSMIAGAVKFNAAIETNRVGLAGLIAAAGDVRDLQGARLSLDEQLNRAQNIAIDQMGRLRAQALQTAASYEEISTAFTQAVAPGLSAGLTLDQIRQVTVDISQAATGLGVAQNQLSEEIRSLFQGTINPRNTRIATALGITGADIKRAKEVGNLFTFISGRFAAISATGERLMNTFTGQLSNAADAFSQLLATASKPLFEQLKSGLKDLQAGVFDIVNGAAVFNPQALKAFQGLFDGLARGVLGIRKAFESVNIQGFADSLGLVGEVLGFIATAIAKAFALFFQIAAPAVTLSKILFATFTSILGVLSKVDSFLYNFASSFALNAAKIGLVYLIASKLLKVFGFMKVLSVQLYTAWVLSGKAWVAMNLASIRFGKSMVFLRTKVLGTLLPLLAVLAVFTAITKLLPEKAKNSFLDGIANGLNYVLSGLDSVFDRMVTLPEEATKATNEGLGIVGDGMRTLAADIQDIVLELEKAARQASDQQVISAKTLGLSSGLSSQISAFYQTIQDAEKELFDARNKQLEIQNKIKAATKEISTLQEGYQAISGSIAFSYSERARKAEALAKLEKEISAAQARTGTGTAAEAKLRGKVFSEADIAAFKKVDDLKAKSVALSAVILEIDNNIAEASKAQLDNFSKIGVISGTRQADSEALVESEKEALAVQEKALRIAVRQAATEAERVNFRQLQQQGLEEEKAAAVLEASLLQASIAGSQTKAALAQSQFEATKAAIELKKEELTYERGEAELSALIDKARKSTNAATRAGVTALTQQLDLLQQAKTLDIARLTAAKARAEEEARIAGIRDNGSLSQGFSLGIKEFADANKSLAIVGENFAKNTADSLGSFVGSSFRSALASAFDPNQNFDLQAAVVNLGLDIISSLVTDLAKNAIANLFTDVVPSATEATGKIATANSVAKIQQTAAISSSATLTTGATTAGSTFAGFISEATAAMVFTINAAAERAAIVAGVSSSVAGGKATGGVARPYLGGTVQGFARGGVAGFGPHKKRRLGIDPRDTIPAWLRPGEWVIRPEAVRHYGHDFMSNLNARRINPDLLRGLTSSPAPAPTPKRSFATGGPVAPSSDRSGSTPTVQRVLQFNDEQTMDRALAAGEESMLRFARKNRSAYRAAFGV